MRYFKLKSYFILMSFMLLCINVRAQTTISSLNKELRGIYQNLKHAPDSTPFLYDMSSHY